MHAKNKADKENNIKAKSWICISCSFALIIYLMIFRADNIVRVIPIILFMWGFMLFDMISKFNFKTGHYIIIFIASVSGILLSPLYFYITYYDKILHLMIPILVSTIVFHMVKWMDVSFAWKLIITASIMLSFSFILEIVEYAMDLFLGMKLQGVFIYDAYSKSYTPMQNGQADTITDMTCALIGGMIYTITRYFHYRKNGY